MDDLPETSWIVCFCAFWGKSGHAFLVILLGTVTHAPTWWGDTHSPSAGGALETPIGGGPCHFHVLDSV